MSDIWGENDGLVAVALRVYMSDIWAENDGLVAVGLHVRHLGRNCEPVKKLPICRQQYII